MNSLIKFEQLFTLVMNVKPIFISKHRICIIFQCSNEYSIAIHRKLNVHVGKRHRINRYAASEINYRQSWLTSGHSLLSFSLFLPLLAREGNANFLKRFYLSLFRLLRFKIRPFVSLSIDSYRERKGRTVTKRSNVDFGESTMPW